MAGGPLKILPKFNGRFEGVLKNLEKTINFLEVIGKENENIKNEKEKVTNAEK